MMPSAIKHYFKYYFKIIQVDLMQLFEYRANMLMIILGTYGYTMVMLFFINVLFTNINEIAGWNYYQMLLLFGTGQMVLYLWWSILSGGQNLLSKAIVKGDLDHYLTKPINAFFAILTSRFELFQTIPSILFALSIIGYAWINLHIPIGVNVLFYLLALLLSVPIATLMPLTIVLLTFWLSDVNDISRLYERIVDLNRYPLDFYPHTIRAIFIFLIPIALLAYVPTIFLLRGFQLDLFLYQLTALVLFITLTKILWTKGLRTYSSASS